MKKHLLAAVVLGLSALSFNAAHGPRRRQGQAWRRGADGERPVASNWSALPDGAAIYVEDHGKPMAPTGMSGKLTVLNGTEKSEADLAAAGDKLEAKGVKLASRRKGRRRADDSRTGRSSRCDSRSSKWCRAHADAFRPSGAACWPCWRRCCSASARHWCSSSASGSARSARRRCSMPVRPQSVCCRAQAHRPRGPLAAH